MPHSTGNSSQRIRQKKGVKSIQIGKEEVNCHYLQMVYIENSTDSIKKWLKLTVKTAGLFHFNYPSIIFSLEMSDVGEAREKRPRGVSPQGVSPRGVRPRDVSPLV